MTFIEYLSIFQFQLTTQDFLNANLNAAKSCFLPEDEKQELMNLLHTEYAKLKFSTF